MGAGGAEQLVDWQAQFLDEKMYSRSIEDTPVGIPSAILSMKYLRMITRMNQTVARISLVLLAIQLNGHVRQKMIKAERSILFGATMRCNGGVGGCFHVVSVVSGRGRCGDGGVVPAHSVVVFGDGDIQR